MEKRNSKYLDNSIQYDSKIGEIQIDNNGRYYRIINGNRIYQIEEKTQRDKDQNLMINRWRASELSLEKWAEMQK